jgi:hypothetical protein
VKKLVVIVLVVAAAFYFRSMKSAREAVIDRNAARATQKSLEPPTPNIVRRQPLKGDPLDDQLKRTQASQVVADSAAKYYTECGETAELLAGRTVQTTPLGGDKVTAVKITSEKMRADYEAFYKTHCGSWKPGRP